MNVNDFDVEIPVGCKLGTIFAHQTELMNKYDPIEEKNMGMTYPHGVFNLHDKFCQLRLKEFAWRVTEEIAEATEALSHNNMVHFHEELIDALHFFVEQLIHAGFTPGLLAGMICSDKAPEADFLEMLFDREPAAEPNISESAWAVVEGIGIAMNCLKNKPWKQSHMLTDERYFKNALAQAFSRFIDLLVNAGYTAETATKMYLNKNAVNQFRIRSRY